MIILAREWLQSKSITVKQFDSELKKEGLHKKGLHGTEPLPDSCRSVTKFLSKNGKAVSHETVRKLLKVNDNLAPEIQVKVKRTDMMKHDDRKDTVSTTDAYKLATIESHEEQRGLLKVFDGETVKDKSKLITQYKQAPEDIKKKIIEGVIKPDDIVFEMKKQVYYKGKTVKERTENMGDWILRLSDKMKDTAQMMDLVLLEECNKGQLIMLHQLIEIGFEKYYKPFLSLLIELKAKENVRTIK